MYNGAMSAPRKPTEQERQEAINLLAEKYFVSDLDEVAEDGGAMLKEALFEDNPEKARLLVTVGADVNYIDKDGDHILTIACDIPNTEVARLLVEAGANVNATNADRETSLMLAAMWDDTELLDILLKAGADLHATDGKDGTALDWAVESKSKECARILSKAGCKRHLEDSPLAVAVIEHDVAEVKKLLSAAQKPAQEDIHKAAKVACELDMKDIFSLLVPHIGKGRIRTLLLDMSALSGMADFVALMLQMGADPNGMDAVKAEPSQMEPWIAQTEGECTTPLLNAVIAGCPECVRLLLHYGAAPDMEDSSGFQPLELAESMGKDDCAEIIRAALRR